MAQIIDYADSKITPDYSAIYFSKGNLLAAIGNPPTLPAAETLEVSWQNNSGGNTERENDLAQILIAADGDDLSFLLRMLPNDQTDPTP